MHFRFPNFIRCGVLEDSTSLSLEFHCFITSGLGVWSLSPILEDCSTDVSTANNPVPSGPQMATMDGSTVAPIPAEEQTHPTVAQRDGEISRHRTEAGDQETISPISFSRRAPTFHRHRIGRTQAVELSVSLNGAGLSVNTIDQFETRCIRCTTQPSHRPSLYVVVGLFSAVDHQPRERVIRIKNHEHLFRELRWATFRLRGLRYFLSLKSVRSFRLYKVNSYTDIFYNSANDPGLRNAYSSVQFLLVRTSI